MSKPLRVGIVAGEVSGDLLGAGLLRGLRRLFPEMVVEGVGGPLMQAEGCVSLYPMETLSVMGLVEVLAHYPRLKRCHDGLKRHFAQNPPDLFIGVDAPDFTLSLELYLKQRGVPTVHYVSPSVWAWREYRLGKIARACDLMLTLFPFEAAYYERRQIPVRCVGHPLAQQLPLHPDRAAARRDLGLEPDAEYLALLPGSRGGEVSRLGPLFLDTAAWLSAQRPALRYLVPLANAKTRALFETQRQTHPQMPLRVFEGQARSVMTAADAVLLASGTATLEAMLCKRPMVVAYRVAPLTFWLAKRLVRVAHVSLPNLLADAPLVPELLQDDATPARLGAAVLDWLRQPQRLAQVLGEFERIHLELRQDADTQAARAVAELLRRQDPLP